MNRHQKAFYLAFIACLFIVWSPFNALAYLSPAIVLVFFLVVTGSRVAGRNLVVWILMWVVAILGHALFVPQFAYHSAVISIVTYSSFAVLFCVSSRNLANPRLLGRLVLWIRWVVLIQAVLGISQAAYGFAQTGSFDLANGDFVEGTIHPWLESEGSFSNPMFATNMVMMLIALAPSAVLKKRGLLPFTLGMIALILASVIHVLLMVALSATVAFLVYRPLSLRRASSYVTVLGLMLASLLAFFLLRRNFGLVYGFARGLLQGESYRAVVIGRTLTEMPAEYPLMPIAGLGPGQFSSRAGLIGTGLFFGGPQNPKPLPLLPQGMSQPFHDYILDVWLEISELSTQGISFGSTHQPYFSWLSVYAEMGIFALLCVFSVTVFYLWRVKLKARSYPERILATSFGTGILFVLLLGMQENYWEVPQAILIGLMILKAEHAALKYAGAELEVGRPELARPASGLGHQAGYPGDC